MSVLDRINQMVEEENREEAQVIQEANTSTGKFLTPLFFALSLVCVLVLTMILISLTLNVSYDFNCWLDNNMLTVTIITGIVLVLTAIVSLVSIFNEFKIVNLILVILSLVGVIVQTMI